TLPARCATASLRALGAHVGCQLGVAPVELGLLAARIREANRLHLRLDLCGTLRNVVLLDARERDDRLLAGLHHAPEEVAGARLVLVDLAARPLDLELLACLVVEVGAELAVEDDELGLVRDAERGSVVRNFAGPGDVHETRGAFRLARLGEGALPAGAFGAV